jgi:hypothetical protein
MPLSLHESLKAIFNDEQVKAIEAAIKDQKVSIVPTEDYIPKHRFDEVSTASKDYKAQHEKAMKDIEALKPFAAGNESLTKQIADLQAQNTEATTKYQAQLVAQQREFALTNSLNALKPKNIKAVKALLDQEAIAKLNIKDDKLEGFESLIEPLKKSDGYLFEDVQTTVKKDRFGNEIKSNPLDNNNGGGTNNDAKSIASKYVSAAAIEELDK